MRLGEGQVWLLILGLVAMSAVMKGIGPALFGGRQLPRWTAGVIATAAPALLAALIATAVLTDGTRIRPGASTAGVAVAAVLLWRRVPLLVAALVAVAVTAGVRAVS